MEAHHFRETGWPDTSYDPLSPPPSARLPQVMPVFYMNAGDLHVCPPAYISSALTHWVISLCPHLKGAVTWVRNVLYRLRLLRTWFSVGSLPLGGAALLEKVCHLGRLWEFIASPHFHFWTGFRFALEMGPPASGFGCLISCLTYHSGLFLGNIAQNKLMGFVVAVVALLF